MSEEILTYHHLEMASKKFSETFDLLNMRKDSKTNKKSDSSTSYSVRDETKQKLPPKCMKEVTLYRYNLERQRYGEYNMCV